MQAALPTPEQVRAAVERAYARPALAPAEPGFFDRMWEAVERFFRDLFGGGTPAGAGDAFEKFLMVLLVVAAVAIIAFFVMHVVGGLRDPDARELRAGGSARPDRPRTADEWEAEARRAAAAGRLREAAVALYQALLLRLEAAGAVRYDPAKTPGEYRREARAHPQARALGGFLRLFEPVAFGGRALDAAGWERLRAAAAEGGARA
ncbi:MAG TPA: DUF4129 domain-containing protein [Longimicrobium sp.]|nr:DUF4129 domain-containing protein [Longimicrobium sp.]